MKNILIVKADDNPEHIFLALREYPSEKVIIISTPDTDTNANMLRQDLERFQTPAELAMIKDNSFDAFFLKVSQLCNSESDKSKIIHASSQAMLSAAYVNGKKAFVIENSRIKVVPILKFSYPNLLTEKKMNLLNILYSDGPQWLEELNKKTQMSLPLLSYHINGNIKSEGLKKLNLVQAEEIKGKVKLSLTKLGTLILESNKK